MNRIIIESFLGRGKRAQRYRVFFNGKLIIRDTANPEFDAARVLVNMGLTGRAEVWDRIRPYPRIIIHDLDKTAQLTVRESDGGDFKIVAWQTFGAGRRAALFSRG